MVYNQNPDIVCLTETKTSVDDANDHVYDCENFVVYRKDRLNQRAPGGGVSILVSKKFCSSDLDIMELNNHHFEDSVWCEIKCEGRPIIVGTVYRAPRSTNENNDLLLDLFSVCDRYSGRAQIIVCGDFNYGAIDWENNCVDSEGQHLAAATKFLDKYNDLYFYQHVDQWTHNRGLENPSRLDLIFSKNQLDVENMHYLSPLGKSHHSVLYFELLMEGNAVEIVDESLRFSHHKGDYKKANDMFRNVDWNSLLEGKNASQMYLDFTSQCATVIENCVPKYKKCSNVRRPKWMTTDVWNQLSVKERAWNRLRARKSGVRELRYKLERNKATEMVRKAKKNFEKSVIRDIKKNSKKFWSYVRGKTKIKENIMRVTNQDGNLTENDEETAKFVNQAFVSVFTQEDSNVGVPTVNYNYNGAILNDLVISEEIVHKLLLKLDVNKSAGPDGITTRLLRECSEHLIVPLTIIFKKSLESGDVPMAWREANVCPIYKKGAKTNPLNYRPVSLTSVVGKVFETLIRDALVKHATENTIIKLQQHGFMKNKSTLTNLLEYLEALTKAKSEKIPVDINYLDCSKAFDTVPHRRLIVKLEGLGIQGKILNWIREFLTDRRQRVSVRGSFSSWLPVVSGVPQGSVLGPVLFLFYINDLVDGLECPILLFADDAKIYKEIRTPADVEALTRDMKRIQEWSEKWLLSFNEDKCATMHIGLHNQKQDYILNNKAIKKSDCEKDLGVLVSNDLKPAKHVAAVALKANRVVGIIKKNFEFLDKETIVSLHLTLVRPILEYAVQSWCPFLVKDVEELEKVQHRITKLVPGLENLSYEERCKELGLPTLKERRLRGDLIEVYKILHGFEGTDYQKFFKLREGVTRGHEWKLEKKEHSSGLERGGWFSIRVINPWNELPPEVVNAPTIRAFKRELDEYMKRNSHNM